MSTPSFWNGERVGVLKRMWAQGITMEKIAEALGCTRRVVEHKAGLLHLGVHPIASSKRPRKVYPDMRGGIASTLKFREEDEGRVIRMPKLSFQSNRLSWERPK